MVKGSFLQTPTFLEEQRQEHRGLVGRWGHPGHPGRERIPALIPPQAVPGDPQPSYKTPFVALFPGEGLTV